MSREFTTYKKVDKEDEESVGSRKPKLIRYDNDDPIYGYSKTLRQGSGRFQTAQPGAVPVQATKSEQQLEEEEFWDGFEPGPFVVFCFRRPCNRTRAHCLNRCASCASNFIHVEICVLSKDLKSYRNLYLTEQTKKVEFVSHVISEVYDERGRRIWDFIWVALSEEQVQLMKNAIYRLAHLDNARKFNKCSIMCFCFFAMPCFCHGDSQSAMCTQTTMEFISEVWQGTRSLMSSNLYSYTPDDVYRFVNRNALRLGVLENLENQDPNLVLRK